MARSDIMDEKSEISIKNGRGSRIDNKSRKSYMAQDNVKKFNKSMREHSMKIGRPYAFDSVERLAEDVQKYFDLCEETNVVPTITSLALWIGCDRDTIYNHANNSNSPFFGILKTAINYCHSTLENGTVDGKVNPVTYIFMAKNYFGLRDDKQITVTPTTEQVNTPATMEALQRQIAEENVMNADYIEK